MKVETRWPALAKTRSWAIPPNLVDYEEARTRFTWDEARAQLDGLPGGRGLNIAHEAVDHHAAGARGARVAFRVIGRGGTTRDLTFLDLRALTNRFATALSRLGVGRGDVVVTLAGRIPELYVAALGALKTGAVYSPFFSAFGPEPIRTRMNLSGARVLVTTETLYRRKIEPHRASMPRLNTSCSWARPAARPECRARAICTSCSTARAPTSRFRPPTPSTRRSCTSRAGRPARRRVRCTCTRPWSRTTRRRSWPSISIPTTSSGARPIRAGSPARRTGSSRR